MNVNITLDELNDDEQATLNRLLQQLSDRMDRNILRSSYYDMKHVMDRIQSGVIPPAYYQLGIVLGWTGKAVDTLARRCNLDGYFWPDGDLNSLGFSDVWEDNNLGAEINQALVSSLIHSTAFCVNSIGEPDEPKSLIHFKDALNATGEWDARLRRLTSFLSITEWDDDLKNVLGFTLYLDNVIYDVSMADNGSWDVARSTHKWGVPAEPLVYRPRLGRPFGSSRISRSVMALQNSATRTVIRLEAHSDIYAIPDLWMFGADMEIFGGKKPWQILMGRIKGIPDDEDAAQTRASVEQIPASDPDPHLKNLKQQAQLFSGETSIPLTSLGVSDMSNPTSSDSYIASREDLIAEAEGATDDWRPAMRRTMIRALAIQNELDEIPDDWKTIDTKWRSPVYTSRAQAADAGVKQLTAIPWLADTELGLELIGLDDQQVKQAVAEKRTAQGSSVLQQILGRTNAGDGSGASAGAVPADNGTQPGPQQPVEPAQQLQ